MQGSLYSFDSLHNKKEFILFVYLFKITIISLKHTQSFSQKIFFTQLKKKRIKSIIFINFRENISQHFRKIYSSQNLIKKKKEKKMKL